MEIKAERKSSQFPHSLGVAAVPGPAHRVVEASRLRWLKEQFQDQRDCLGNKQTSSNGPPESEAEALKLRPTLNKCIAANRQSQAHYVIFWDFLEEKATSSGCIFDCGAGGHHGGARMHQGAAWTTWVTRRPAQRNSTLLLTLSEIQFYPTYFRYC